MKNATIALDKDVGRWANVRAAHDVSTRDWIGELTNPVVAET